MTAPATPYLPTASLVGVVEPSRRRFRLSEAQRRGMWGMLFALPAMVFVALRHLPHRPDLLPFVLRVQRGRPAGLCGSRQLPRHHRQRPVQHLAAEHFRVRRLHLHPGLDHRSATGPGAEHADQGAGHLPHHLLRAGGDELGSRLGHLEADLSSQWPFQQRLSRPARHRAEELAD